MTFWSEAHRAGRPREWRPAQKIPQPNTYETNSLLSARQRVAALYWSIAAGGTLQCRRGGSVALPERQRRQAAIIPFAIKYPLMQNPASFNLDEVNKQVEEMVNKMNNNIGDRISRKAWRLESQSLCDQARRKTGLEDFGEPAIEPALSILTTSLEDEANLHPLGRLLIRIHLKDLLEGRLRMAKQYKSQSHAVSDQPVRSPIFIMGMPRSGSTFLHELLVEDSAMRAPRVWEVMSPASAAEPDQGWRDLRIWKVAWDLWWFRRIAPQIDAVYPMRARTPQECIVIHSYTFLSEEFLCTFRLPAYHAFLRSSDLRPAYAWQKRFLQYLQSGRPATQWVLKSPDHVRGLDALFSVFPDARIVQTHRSPLDVLRSAIHLTEVLHRLYARPPSREWIAETEAKSLVLRMERLIQFRDQHPELADRFVDVNYSDLTANPLGVVRRIYQHFGMPLSSGAVERMSRLAESRSAYKGRRRALTLSEVGLNPSVQIKMFSEYCRRFGLPSGSAT